MNRIYKPLFLLLLALLALTATSGALIAPADASGLASSLTGGDAAGMAAGPIPPLPIDNTGGYLPPPGRYLSEWSYEDASLSVRIVKERAHDTDYLIAYVKVADASQVRTAVAGRHNSEELASGARIARRVNAVLAINGDFYSFRQNGYIVRQGTRHRQRPNGLDTLLIDDHGDLHVVEYATRDNVDAYIASLDGREIINSFAFGPLLVRDGKAIEEIHYFDKGTVKPTQRMGIAQTGPLEYMCVSTEGPEDPGSAGFTVEQFAALMESLGADIAYNLDGGSSNTLVFNGQKVNSPKNPKVRSIFDILYFATAIPSEAF